jgi:SAM-dependent methyltransferase
LFKFYLRRLPLNEYLRKRLQQFRYKQWLDRNPTLDAIRQDIDWPRFEDCRRQLISATLSKKRKYLNFQYWLDDALFRAWQLGLHERPELNILDISTGPGYFLIVCRHFGHACAGTDAISLIDRTDIQIYKSLGEIFGLERHDLFIEPFKEMPDLGRSFDLVTAYKIAFNNLRKQDQWGFEEWMFFVESCHRNLLKGPGEIFLNFNYDGREFMPREFKKYLRSIGTVCYNDAYIVFP